MKELAVHCTLYFQYDDEDVDKDTDPYSEARENLGCIGVDYQLYDCEFREE